MNIKPRKVRVNNTFKHLKCSQKEIKKLIHAIDSLYTGKLNSGEFSVAFMSNKKLSQLHEQFLSDPSETDVITFQGDPSFNFAGELCISVERAYQMAKKLNVPFSQELTLYIVHGYLHLIGFDDHQDSDRKFMKQQEKIALNFLIKNALIPNFEIQAQ